MSRPAITDKATPCAMVQIVYGAGGRVVETPVAGLSEFAPKFSRTILIIEDNTSDSDRCRAVLHELGYDGIQLITTLQQATEYLDDVLNQLTRPPHAIILDLGLGYDSGFALLRKRHAHPQLQQVPILVWSKSAESHTEALSTRLGAKDFLIKSADKETLRTSLKKLLDQEAT
ncbi:MAG TPA: response regulator [Terriglobales bacterium]|nr:response regulator [Terriglobales bacterium]